MFETSADRSKSRGEKYTLRKSLFGDADLLPMWVADMDIDTPPCVVDAIKRRAMHPNYGYEMMGDDVYEAQIEWMQRRHGVSVKREWMFYSHSVVASISAAIMAFTARGDEVVVQTPIYPPFISTVLKCDREVLLNPLKCDGSGSYDFDFDDLCSKITDRTKLLLLCSPHNPVGRVWSLEELQRLVDICLEHNIVIFADEIHSDLIFKPYVHTPLLSIKESKPLLVTAVGPGKTFNLASLCISTVIIEDETLRERFDKVYESMHFSSGNTFAHTAFLAAYRHGEPWLEQLLVHLQQNMDLLSQLLDRSDKIKFNQPMGTYLAWLDCSGFGFRSDRALREFFIEELRLGLSPGISFGKEGRAHMRLNFAVSSEIFEDALHRISKVL